MIKTVLLLWPAGQAMDPATRRRVLLEDCAPQLLEAGAVGLQMNIADDCANVPSPAPEWPWLAPAFVAQVNVWTNGDATDDASLDAQQAILFAAGFRIAAYRVDEWLYTDYGENEHSPARDWADGDRSPGILAVTLLERPKRVAKDEWMRRWFGWQSPMSEWMQPRPRYVRNVVEQVLTDDAFAYAGIVEEDWPSGRHVTDPYLFYSAKNFFQLAKHMMIMLRSVSRLLPFFRIRTVMMSEYFLRSPG